MTDLKPTVVTLDTWRPGLPPPIEALRQRFPPERGYTIEYGTWIEDDDEGGSRTIPVATVRWPGGQVTFFPKRPHRLPKSP